MKVNLFVTTSARVTPEERRALRPVGRNSKYFTEVLQELEWLAIAADERGIDSFGCAEHHFHTDGNESMPNSMMFFTRLASVTKNIGFIPLSIVLPATNPLRVAEDVALFDNLFPGRISVQFARGYVQRWMQTLAQQENIASTPFDPISDLRNREVFEEYVDIILKAWTEDSFNFHGKHFQVPFPASGIPNYAAADWLRAYGDLGEIDDADTIHKIGVVPKPISQPHPQVWMPMALSLQTLTNAAKRGFVTVVYDGNSERFRGLCETYQAEAAKAGRKLSLGQNIAAMRKIFIGSSYEEAFENAVKTVGYWHNGYFSKWGITEGLRLPTDDPNKLIQFDTDAALVDRMIEAGWLLCGTPDDISHQLERLYRCYGNGELDWLVWEWWVANDDTRDDQQRRLDLFVEKLWPRFK